MGDISGRREPLRAPTETAVLVVDGRQVIAVVLVAARVDERPALHQPPVRLGVRHVVDLSEGPALHQLPEGEPAGDKHRRSVHRCVERVVEPEMNAPHVGTAGLRQQRVEALEHDHVVSVRERQRRAHAGDATAHHCDHLAFCAHRRTVTLFDHDRLARALIRRSTRRPGPETPSRHRTALPARRSRPRRRLSQISRQPPLGDSAPRLSRPAGTTARDSGYARRLIWPKAVRATLTRIEVAARIGPR